MWNPIVFVAVFGLMGCAHSTPSDNRSSTPLIPVSLTVECPALRPLTTGLCPEVTAALVRDSLQYHECATRHKALVNAVKAREAHDASR